MRLLKLMTVAGVAAVLAASASAQFSVSGGGSPIPASGSGGGGTFPTVLPPTPAVSTVVVPEAVTSITSVEIADLNHTWSGDTQATLSDPNGVQHLLWLRPGQGGSGSSFGNSGDFTGTISIVESGGATLPISGDIAPGAYNQSFETGTGVTWNSGDAGIDNTALSAISGPAGTWTLSIYDWGGGDSGSFSGWTLNGNPAEPPSDIYFTHLYQVDLGFTADPNGGFYVGTNPSAVALLGEQAGKGGTWDVLRVAGFNNSGDAGNTGLVTVVRDSSNGSAVINFLEDTRSTPGLRGFSGLDITGEGNSSTTISAFDTGSAVADGISAYDLFGNKLWDVTARGGSGCAVDPGPGAPLGANLGSGAAWTSFGSGRRSLNDLATGANIWTSSDGMIINGAGTGTFWRDMDFNDANGDIWLREGNNLISATRTGDNSVTNTTLVVDEVEADFTAGQNLAYIQGRGAVIYNERSSTAGGQAFFDSVRVVNEDGTTRGTNWGGYAPADSNAYYDFSYDAAAGRLAILDFANRTVDVFLVGDAPNTGNAYCFGDGTGAACPCTNGDAGAGCANSDGTSALLTGSGDADVADDKFRLSVSGAKANSFCIFARGSAVSGVTPFGNGIRCIDLAQRGPIVVTDGTGSASRTGLGASVSAGETADYQVFYRDTADTCGGGFNTSNGWTVTWN